MKLSQKPALVKERGRAEGEGERESDRERERVHEERYSMMGGPER